VTGDLNPFAASNRANNPKDKNPPAFSHLLSIKEDRKVKRDFSI
jgi:hypothetical protein